MSDRTIKVISTNKKKTRAMIAVIAIKSNGKKTSRTYHVKLAPNGKWITPHGYVERVAA